MRDIPTGTLSSLAVCTVLYIAVALVATGCVPYTQFKGIAHPISYAVRTRRRPHIMRKQHVLLAAKR